MGKCSKLELLEKGIDFVGSDFIRHLCFVDNRTMFHVGPSPFDLLRYNIRLTVLTSPKFETSIC